MLVMLAACGLLGMSGGLLYGSCATDECTLVTFRQLEQTAGDPSTYVCFEYEEAQAHLLRSSDVEGGDKTLYPDTLIKRWEKDGGCSSCLCPDDGQDRMCLSANGARVKQTEVNKYYCKQPGST